MPVIHDDKRDYLERPLNINYKVLPKENALCPETQWVFMCFARCGNKPSTFRDLQAILDAIKPNNTSKINAIIGQADRKAREHNSGIKHDDDHPCCTVNFHHVCTKRARFINAEGSSTSTLVAYIDSSLLDIFNDSGRDSFYPDMKILAKRKPTVPSDLEVRKRRSEDEHSSTETSKKSRKEEDFSSSAVPVTTLDSTTVSGKQDGLDINFSDLFGNSSFDDLHFEELDAAIAARDAYVSAHNFGGLFTSDSTEIPSTVTNEELDVASSEHSSPQELQLYNQIAPTLDFLDAVEEFFSEKVEMEQQQLLPLFTEDLLTNHDHVEYDSSDLMNMLGSSGNCPSISMELAPMMPNIRNFERQPMNYHNWNVNNVANRFPMYNHNFGGSLHHHSYPLDTGFQSFGGSLANSFSAASVVADFDNLFNM